MSIFNHYQSVFLLLWLGCCQMAVAQVDSVSVKKAAMEAQEKSTEQPKKSYFESSLTFLSSNIYNGRKDSLTSQYTTTSIGYCNKLGFYITGSLSFLSNVKESRIDLFELTAGYDFSIIKDILAASVSANKDYYNSQSTSVKSGEKGSLNGSLSYDLDFLQLDLGAGMLFGTKNDFNSNLSLAHAFSIEAENASSWSFTPTVTANLSTLHFYEAYTNRKVQKITKKKDVTSTVTSVTIVNNHHGLTLMDYEVKLPMVYESKKWGVSLTPQLAIPQNSINTTTTTTQVFKKKASIVTTEDTTPDSEKNLRPLFYVEAEIHFNLFTGREKAK